MPILNWEKPKKKMTPDEWRDSYGFDGGPPGGFVPNMSIQDAKSWKAVLTGVRRGYPQVEIRKTLRNSIQLTIIVNLGEGYFYKHLQPMSEYEGKTPADFTNRGNPAMYTQDYINELAKRDGRKTRGINIHMAMNGGGQMTFAEMAELHQAVEEARVYLENVETLRAGHAAAKKVAGDNGHTLDSRIAAAKEAE